MSADTILQLLLKRKKLDDDGVAIQFKDGNHWLYYKWSEYFSLIEAVGASMIKLGVEPGDCVAIISDTSPEWIIADMAIMGVGAITVPIYPNNLENDVQYIINNVKARILIIENAEQAKKWEKIKSHCPSIKSVIIVENKKQTANNFISWTELLNRGRETLRDNPQIFSEKASKRQLSEVATIIHTSGTTGNPKGVVLTHEQIMSELIDVFRIVTVNNKDISLSFLPYSHVLGRIEAWGSIYAGYTLAFAESIDRLQQNLKEVKPTFIIAVPRIFEKIYSVILSQVENSQTKGKVFEKALNIGNKVSHAIQARKHLGVKLSLEYEIIKVLAFNNILKAFGGRLRFAISGGAPLSTEISQFFHGLGLLICEGYGLTETTGGISFNTALSYKFGSVGKPLPEVQVKIAEDGEVLIKSKKVMKEYYLEPEATNEVMVDGYLKSGDIGYIDKNGFLFITDRKKDLIKTAGGKYVAPQKLENMLKLNPNISNVLIHGDQKKYIIALITVAPHLQTKAREPETYRLIKDAVAEANLNLASFESIKKFAILPNDFYIETGELTPSLKVRRKFCDQKYKKEINDMY
ncbi:MAG: long-chain fatty acid--CoA ligase [Bdellovibrionales bacterium RBG_16_40_8]|nr:MAG: long-chain fatty acid--CoA ligase [Bdellovibrionales bacterium RBG_16_40_8]